MRAFEETKNNFFTWWATWLLSIMETGGKKRMKGILLTNLIVGHTHDKVDRFFSRIRAVLAGVDYYTWQQVRDLLIAKMRGFNMEMEHLTTAWCWKELDALGLDVGPK